MRGRFSSIGLATVVVAASAFVTPPSDAGVINIFAQSGARGTLQDGNGDGVVNLSISPVDQLFQSSIIVRTFSSVNSDSRGIAEFDIRGVEAIVGDSSRITSARLVLTAFTGGSITPVTPNGISITPGLELNLHGYVGNGSIGVNDFGQGTLLASQTLDGLSNVVTFGLTNFVLPQVVADASFIGVNLRTPLNPQTSFAQFRTGPDPFQPRLVIEFDDAPQPPTAVSEPAMFTVFAAGLFGLAALNSHRRRRTSVGPFRR